MTWFGRVLKDHRIGNSPCGWAGRDLTAPSPTLHVPRAHPWLRAPPGLGQHSSACSTSPSPCLLISDPNPPSALRSACPSERQSSGKCLIDPDENCCREVSCMLRYLVAVLLKPCIQCPQLLACLGLRVTQRCS